MLGNFECILVVCLFFFKVREKAKIRNQYNQGHHIESDKNTGKHHTQESKDVSPFPTSDHKNALNITVIISKYATKIVGKQDKQVACVHWR